MNLTNTLAALKDGYTITVSEGARSLRLKDGGHLNGHDVSHRAMVALHKRNLLVKVGESEVTKWNYFGRIPIWVVFKLNWAHYTLRDGMQGIICTQCKAEHGTRNRCQHCNWDAS